MHWRCCSLALSHQCGLFAYITQDCFASVGAIIRSLWNDSPHYARLSWAMQASWMDRFQTPLKQWDLCLKSGPIPHSESSHLPSWGGSLSCGDGNVINDVDSWVCCKSLASSHYLYHADYRKTSNTRCTLLGDNIVDHSDVVGAWPVGPAPTTSSWCT